MSSSIFTTPDTYKLHAEDSQNYILALNSFLTFGFMYLCIQFPAWPIYWSILLTCQKKHQRQELHSFGFYIAVKQTTSINLVLKPKTWEALVDISLSLNSRPAWQYNSSREIEVTPKYFLIYSFLSPSTAVILVQLTPFLA